MNMSTTSDTLDIVSDLPKKDDVDNEDFTESEFLQRHRHSYRSSSLIPSASTHNIRMYFVFNFMIVLLLSDIPNSIF